MIGAGLLLGTFPQPCGARPRLPARGRADRPAAGSEPWRLFGQRVHHWAKNLLTRIRALPGVASAAGSQITPISGSAWNDFIKVDGFSAKSERDALAYFNEVSDGYFTTLGNRCCLAGGATSSGHRDRSGAPGVAIVNEAVVKKFLWRHQPALSGQDLLEY